MTEVIPEYPIRGRIPWDAALKTYIDYGDSQTAEGTPGPPGLPGIPGGDTVQSIWTWEITSVSSPLARGLIGVTDPPPREATELVTSYYDINAIGHLETLQALQSGDRIYLQVPNDPNSWHCYEITDLPVDQGSSTYSIPVRTYGGSPPSTAPIEPITVLTSFQFMPRSGPEGPPGPPGPIGPPGSGTAENYSFVYNSGSPASVWIVHHNLGWYPSVTVVDSGGTVIVPDVFYDDNNTVTLTFGSPTSGKVFLS
jgi:hypothetical protein